MEGYGRSTKDRGVDATISEGADDLKAATDYIFKTRNHTGPLLVYGISSGALRAALFAQRHPNRVKRLALDAHVWTGEGSPTLVERRKKLPEYLKTKRRPIDRKFVRSIFERDHPGTADDKVIEAFATHILELDDSIPNGTYIDMCNHLPVVDPTKIVVPTIVMRGEYDGIAGFKDLLNFFEALPNPDKQFAVMPGIAHASFQQKNYMIAYHILLSFFTQPEPIYRRTSRAKPQSTKEAHKLRSAVPAKRHGPLCARRGHRRYSITSSAVARSCGWNSSPSALAVFRLMTNSNLADCTTGRSAGFSPLIIRPA